MGDACPECGALSYQGGYCLGCGKYRPSKHNIRDEDTDAASFMDADFGHRLHVFNSESDGSSDEFEGEFNLGRSPRKRAPHIREELDASPEKTPPAEPRSPARSETPPPPQPVELSISERIEMLNRGLKQHPAWQLPLGVREAPRSDQHSSVTPECATPPPPPPKPVQTPICAPPVIPVAHQPASPPSPPELPDSKSSPVPCPEPARVTIERTPEMRRSFLTPGLRDLLSMIIMIGVVMLLSFAIKSCHR